MSNTCSEITATAASLDLSTSASPPPPGASVLNMPGEILIEILGMGPPSPVPFLVCKSWNALRGEISKKWTKIYAAEIGSFSQGTRSQRLQTIGDRVVLLDQVDDAIRHINTSHPTAPTIEYKREELDALQKVIDKDTRSMNHKYAIFCRRISPASNPTLVGKGMITLELAVMRHAEMPLEVFLRTMTGSNSWIYDVALARLVQSDLSKIRRHIMCGGLAWVVGFIRGLRSLNDHPITDLLPLTGTYDPNYYA